MGALRFRFNLHLLWAVVVLLTLSGCDRRSKMYTSALISLGSQGSSGTSSLAISLAVIDDMKAALVKAEMTPAEAHIVASGALQGLNNTSGQTFFGLVDPDFQPESAIPRLTGAAVQTLSDPRAGQVESEGKLKYSAVIAEGVVESLGSGVAASALTPEQKKALPGGITKSAVSNLDEAGLSGKDLSSGIGKVMKGAVAKLKGVGFATSDLKDVVSSMTKDTIEGMAEIGLSKSLVGDSMESLVKSTVGALGEAGVTAADVGSFVGPIMSEAVGGLDELGLSGAGQMQTVVGNLVSSSMLALEDVGVTDINDVSVVLNSSMKGAMEGMGDANIQADKFATFVDDMMEGAVESLDDIGIKDAASIKAISANAAQDTIEFLDEVGVNDTAVFSEISVALNTGACKGFGALKKNGTLTAADVGEISAEVSREGQKAIAAEGAKLGFSAADLETMQSGYAVAAVSGFAEAGMDLDTITVISDAIDEASDMDLSAALNTAIAGMKADCEAERGVWYDEQGGRCEYPLDEPEDDSSLPSFEEEEACYESGGFILFLPNGSWVCDLSEVEVGMDSEADCIEAGIAVGADYQWARDGEGPYCETGVVPSLCWLNHDQLSCDITTQACSWMEGYCQDDSFLTCQDFEEPNVCSARPDCFWEAETNECYFDFCASEPEDPSCQEDIGGVDLFEPQCEYFDEELCTQDPICGWFQTDYDFGFCYVEGLAACSANFSDPLSCDAFPVCSWNVGSSSCGYSGPPYCFLHEDQTSCEDDDFDTHNVCHWVGDRCQIDNVAECSIFFDTEDGCNLTEGCDWSGSSCVYGGPTVCGLYGDDSTSCDADSKCSWDPDFLGGKCREESPAMCEITYESDSSCNSDENCEWDDFDSFCRTSDEAECAALNEESCGDSFIHCSWNADENGGICEYSGFSSCYDNSDEASCDENARCYWDRSKNICDVDHEAMCVLAESLQNCTMYGSHCDWSGASCDYIGPTACYSIEDESSCGAESICSWDGDIGWCDYDVEVLCETMFEDEETCSAQGFCSWNGSTCQAEDYSAPDFTAVSFDQNSYDNSSDLTATLTITATDSSGIDLDLWDCWRIENDSDPNKVIYPGAGTGSKYCGSLSHMGGDDYQLSFVISRYLEAGTYRLIKVALGDLMGWHAQYYEGGSYPGYFDHNGSLAIPSFTLAGTGNSDLDNPTVTSVGFEKSSQIFPADDGYNAVVFVASDAKSGLMAHQGNSGWVISDGSHQITVAGPIIPTGNTDEYKIPFKVSQWSANGSWSLQFLCVYDKAGNSLCDTAASNQLPVIGISAPTFTISGASADYDPPVVDTASQVFGGSMGVGFSEANYSPGADVLIGLKLDEDVSGFNEASSWLVLKHEESGAYYSIHGGFAEESVGYQFDHILNPSAGAGTYILWEMVLKDMAGNEVIYQYRGSWPGTPYYDKSTDRGGSFSSTTVGVPYFTVGGGGD